ncbi:efflux RND transporter permease subunit [Flavilitoribacter nigricans]|uniref:RND transporter n=1 Tax=Flavilitoribacter nigricans (strain ATCC 23147 / DSM 23189 / NBRC 102662 / NCIMB 1420 / SS-2) TaxID=1122177 RepID=A0A2D0NHN8_FLAN2|nr:efflux RND transporter permease subunit [Flavilitoribacter nigricans]PHN08024.1 RND transporter [Flavilitoribacter nigricans DSM 23189 = NBRC 102662]
MRGFINYFIKYGVAANLLMVGLLILGVVSMFSIKSTFFPEVESRIISIQIVYPGASPEEIEEGVISKIEENLKGLTGVERYTSVSSENSGTVMVEVFKGYDTDVILQDVKNAVDRINSFPVGMEPAVVYKQEFLGFAINFALSGDVDLRTLKRYGREVEDDLRAIDGISKVELSGFPDEEIEIAFRERDLRSYNMTFQQATQAIRAANLDITGGTLKSEKEELLIRARNKEYYADGLRDIIVKTTADGSVVRLYQIADIRDKWADNPDRSFLNDDASVIVTVQNTLEEDLLTVAENVRNYLEGFNERNDIVQATIIRDGSEILQQRMSLLTKNGVQGFIIVMILLAMFLHWRLAFWVALAIPISFAGMFVVANLLDITFNVISLFGMIIVIGILVDDGIVIGENIYQQYEKGVPRFQAALNGTMQVLPAVFAAIITTIIAFSTFLFIDGNLGDFFAEMSIVVIFSLVFSLVEGAIILPTHVAHSKALSKDRKPNAVQRNLDKLMNFMRDTLYAPALRFSMQNKFLTICIAVAALILTIGSIGGGIIRTTFFPVIERDNINITLQMPAGTREQVTEKWLTHIEDAAKRANEKLSQQFFNGEKEAIERIQMTIGPSTFRGSIDLAILDGENRDPMKVRDVINAIREEAGTIPQAEVVTYGSQSAFGKPVSISLVGEDYPQLQKAIEAVKLEMQQLAELTDVVDNNQEGLREINISLKDKARYLGLNLQEVLGQVRSGFFGSEVQRLQRGRDEVRVWVRYDEEDRKDITQLQDMRVRFLDGREYPLSEIANLEIDRGVININHLDGKREVKVEADVANDNVSVSDLTTNLKEVILPSILVDYPGVQAKFEGQNREQEKSAKSLQTVGTVVLALMFFVIALTFRSINQTIAVFLLIPFGLIGVGWGHWLLDKPISFFSILGFIALVGILVNDALVFVSTYNDNIRDGQKQMDALYDAGLSRFRPIILTSLTTFAGLAPLLLEKSLQAQFLIPMAISVSFGLLAITFIILLVLPAMLIINNRIKVYTAYAWNAKKPTYTEVEPAAKELQEVE